MSRAAFSLLETEIGAGPLLIEASAGTGKTYTIAGLVLRLLLERAGLTIAQILVTTFTELATAELRGRIRDLLRDALLAFESGQSEDPLLAAVLEKYPEHQSAVVRLKDALAHFDEAPIYTIHGFCQRVLAEQAFETGTLFDAELVTDERDLLREVTWDFWRRNFYVTDSVAGLLGVQGRITPNKLLKDLEELVKNPMLTVLPKDFPSSTEAAEKMAQALGEVRAGWPPCAADVRAFFANPAWAKGDHKDAARLAVVLEDLEQVASNKTATARQFDSIELLATDVMVGRGLRKGSSLPENPIFALCQRFVDRADDFCTALRVEFHAWAPGELRRRKQAQNVLAFEDLLTQLDDALQGPDGEVLAESIRQEYRVALVDEFQDTDPVQYSIFERVYQGSEATVAFIGDPKQAIYSFRGADVFTYLNAARTTARQFTLGTNWRSESGLVRAVNAIFDRSDSFHLEEIKFKPAEPSPRADQAPLLLPGKTEAPFHIWTSSAKDDLAGSTASEIVRLLGREATIGGTKLEPGHVAVLTNTNAQAMEVQKALRDRRVPSVLYSSANVFTSREAHEMRDVLAAVAQVGNEKLVRAALCTDALGFTGNQIDALSRDEVAWEKDLSHFQEHHNVWRERGFVQMLRHLAVAHGVRQRLLGYPDGERRLTNFLHLSELMHAACAEHRLGMHGTLKWLAEQMQTGNTAPREECELRLESDEKAVRIITVHKSKGLEFDVTFCPFVGTNAITRQTFHDPAKNYRLTLDLSGDKKRKPLQEQEALAESLRLLYVAVTRARHRCTMVWPAKAKREKSATAFLLGRGEQPAIDAVDIAIEKTPAPNDHVFHPENTAAPLLLARQFTGSIDRSWGIASFTRLVSGRAADARDEGLLLELATATEEIPEATGIHAFRRGTTAGTCLHEILEKVDFADLNGAREVVARQLRAYGIDGFDEIVNENVRELAALPLAARSERFALREVPNEARIAELEFVFPITHLTNAKLAEAFALRELPLALERLQFSPVNGFMNGFIDLTFERQGRFYFADWKSNWLGPNTASYRPAAIAAELQRNLYSLQLCLYSVALHRFLRARKADYDFDRHFGGAFYVFLRGIDPAQPENGVYFERPSRAFLEKLDRIFER
ncbi:MAG: exodeoxyribonuclease V subunit beta [Chthoniobacterales bacterium]